MRLAIVGGGAAGFFLAVNVKRMAPALDVTIFERATRVLRKVEVSGGGRCNCTNTFAEIGDLRQAYPRGAKLMKRLFRRFSPDDAYRWFEEHGVPLVVQDDQCVFPQAQDSHAIIGCLVGEARQLGVKVVTGKGIERPAELLTDYRFVAVTTGGTPHGEGCVPSLFSFNIDDDALKSLMGTVVDHAIASIPGSKLRAEGALLITHWGVSGPAILRLSSYAARHLAEYGYRSPLLINWTGNGDSDGVRLQLDEEIQANPTRLIENLRPFALPSRLWEHITMKAEAKGQRCATLSRKKINRLADLLCNDAYNMTGRCRHKEEFVTCGGVALESIEPNTLESRDTPGLYYAGEVLDIDGITGGFNLQAAWTTAYTVAMAIAEKAQNG